MCLRLRPFEAIPSLQEVDRHLNEIPGKYSWPFAGLKYLSEVGFETQIHSLFDVEQFIIKPDEYLRAFYGGEEGEDQVRNTDLNSVTNDVKSFLAQPTTSTFSVQPDLRTIQRLIGEGYYVIPEVNQKPLQGDTGYVGHFIFAYGKSPNGVLMHNPGPPPIAASEVGWYTLDRAWNFARKSSRILLAVKPPPVDGYYDYFSVMDRAKK